MTPIQGEPPKLDFKLPKKLKRFLVALRNFCVEIQPIDSLTIGIDATVKGRKLRTKGEDELAAAIAATHNLKLTSATEGGVAKVNVSYGTTGGRDADPSMTLADGLDVTLTTTAVKYILADITWSYSAPLWTSTASAIIEWTSATKAETATHSYFEIGRAERESDGAGGFRVKSGTIHNECTGSQGVVRQGTASTYIDGHWLI